MYTKKQAEQEFRAFYLPSIIAQEKEWGNGKDSVFRCEEWSYYIDMLCKAGKISNYQYNNWNYPNFC